jgi:hypothetical protein
MIRQFQRAYLISSRRMLSSDRINMRIIRLTIAMKIIFRCGSHEMIDPKHLGAV